MLRPTDARTGLTIVLVTVLHLGPRRGMREWAEELGKMLDSGVSPSEDDCLDQFAGTPYRQIRKLGVGETCGLYLVEHTRTRRPLVAKLIPRTHRADRRLVERMRIEAQVLGRLNHEHIVKVVGAGVIPACGRPYLVTEHLQGRSLAAEIRERGGLPLDEALAFMGQLLAALEETHAKAIVHRDIKPENLFIAERPDGSRYLKVVDFGLARVLPENQLIDPLPPLYQTEPGMVLGTPRHASPEGAMGLPVDFRADIYAAGLVLQAMLARRGSSRSIPAGVDQIVLRALSREPAARFQSAGEFREALARVKELPLHPSRIEPSSLRVVAVFLAGMSIAVLLSAGVYALFSGAR